MKAKKLMVAIMMISLVKVDIVLSPAHETWGWPEKVQYDSARDVFVDNNACFDNWMVSLLREEYLRYTRPRDIPAKRTIVFSLRTDLFSEKKYLCAASILGMAKLPISRRRLVLINPEQSINETAADKLESRMWPHLGLLYVGTVADQEGWDVALHDELVEGYIDLERVVQPGDVVGLSLVVTGMERGVELARQAKRLGASCVIAGNDSASFRADQLLRLQDRPVDAVFTTNGLTAVRQFLRQIGTVALEQLNIPGVAVIPTGVNLSNEPEALRAEREAEAQLRKEGIFDPHDVFVVPKLSLFSDEYWQKVWQNYRTIFGHKHRNPMEVRNGLALFAQGCTRAAGGIVCSYCTIKDVAAIRLPTKEHLEQIIETYQSFGINYVFNATDSVLEMRRVVHDLKEIGAFFPEGLMIYGRAWGLAHHPEAIDEWLSLTGGRLLINVGMDSGDERILSVGVDKASQPGSRLEENRQAVHNIAASGAHLHFSLIFGSPGETRETCEKSLEFFEWTRATLGLQLDQCETDIYWLNHGSPASAIFDKYEYAQELARVAGKEISRSTWEDRFHRHRDTLSVPWSCEEAWYDCFTSITVEEAQKYNSLIASAMARHEGAAPGRGDMCRAFRPS